MGRGVSSLPFFLVMTQEEAGISNQDAFEIYYENSRREYGKLRVLRNGDNGESIRTTDGSYTNPHRVHIL